MRQSACVLVFVLGSALCLPAAGQAANLPDASPQDVSQARAKLYLAASREPRQKLAPQIYELALNSELCRLNSGAKLCGLSTQPLQDGSFEAIFNYYVKQPVDSVLNQQQIETRKADWTWQAKRNGGPSGPPTSEQGIGNREQASRPALSN